MKAVLLLLTLLFGFFNSITNKVDSKIDSFEEEEAGTYIVTITDSNSCTAVSSGALIFQPKICLPVTIAIKRGTRN